MSRTGRVLLKNTCYHLMIRGNQKLRIFLDEQDYKTYLSRLRKYKGQYGFLLYGFCLMPNHVHIIGEPVILKNLPKFMQSLNRSYTYYFNRKYDKVGHLWQGRFISKIIIKDTYLIDCIHYVELNPVRADIVQVASNYRWSSHKERVLTNNTNTNMLNKLRI